VVRRFLDRQPAWTLVGAAKLRKRIDELEV